jgi:hypothetical protein
MNASDKWDALRDKIEESACSIFCLQETKREHIDTSSIRNFASRHFDCFEFISSIGASGGLLVLWCSSVFSGLVLEKNSSGSQSFSPLHTMAIAGD